MKKSIVVGIILLFLLSSLIPITSSYSSYETNKVYSIHIDENGTLSGYVKDTSMNPIEGARIEVYFHETYEEDYSDSSGYYHVTNIPICYCLKNATVSKKGYRSECVLLSIDETTIHNFVLTPLGNTLYVGGNGPGNYSRIQDAIDNASDNDTIYVYNGTYYENVIVDKSINLIGENKDSTIIIGNEMNPCVRILINYVNSSGFTILNDDGTSLAISSSYNTISDNIFSSTRLGIWVSENSQNNKFYHNNFIDNIQHAHDEGTNIWDNGYPSGGNYWDDYTGIDENDDAIGDTPYNILGGNNKDLYPLIYSVYPPPPYIVYIDDDYTSSTPGWGYDHFNIIQDGVDVARDGGTIYVYNGIYNDYFPENWACVKITKSINLVGEDKHTTIINGSGFQRAVIIYAEDVNVSGFTIQHGKNPKTSDWILGIDIHHYKTNNIRIFDNIIVNTSRGIYTHQTSANIQIYDNLIMNNYYGIENAFDNAPLNVFNNIITNNEYGIHSSYGEMVLSNNLISNNNVGIYMRGIDANYTISTNEISHNGIGITLDNSRSTITHNNFINNEKEVKVSMDIYFFTIPKFFYYKQKWISNYWDDWDIRIPRAILGFGIFYIIILKIHPKLTTPFPIAIFPYFEHDWHPAKEPYDIP